MAIYAVWPFYLCIVLLMTIAASPVFAAAGGGGASKGRRVITLDGLRGFLALGVYFHHAAVYHAFILGLGWHLPPSQFYTMLGQGGVAAFFMITGYLFWDRMIRTFGRPGWVVLYIGRVFRIGPIYFVAIIFMIFAVFYNSGMKLRVGMLVFLKQLAHWSMLGYDATGLNGDGNAPRLLAYVTWSLHYEWLFYFSLPIIAIAARWNRLHLPFAATGLIVVMWYATLTSSSTVIFAALFLVGMLVASLQQRALMPKLPPFVASGLVVASVSLAFALFPTAYEVGSVVLFGTAFGLIASGCAVFGILATRAARRLGEVSYGIYLLQGLVLALLYSSGSIRRFALESPLNYWIMSLAGAVILILTALLAHVVVERPGIGAGRRLIGALVQIRLRALG
ncbi:MAG: acyltransferase [Rhodospirillales bacterium]|nr:acyltransferase [Rhodospirillales bacterium]